MDVAIVTKDILEDLVKAEGWDYANMVPEGRRSAKLPRLAAFAYFSFKTILNLFLHARKNKYDLFVTDDLLVVIGKLKNIPTIFFTDDDLEVVQEVAPLYAMSSTIVAPNCTSLGKYKAKKTGYNGYHELAYLHPKYFTPDFNKTVQFNPSGKKYFILRLVALTATHDKGKKGISNQNVRELISLLEKQGNVYITSERPLPEEFEKHRIQIKPADIGHALYFAEMFIGDSQTMTSEAAILGTPAIRFNDFVGKISSMEEKEHKYGITYGFKTHEFDKLFQKVKDLLAMPDIKQEWQKRVQKMLADCDDTNEVILNSIYAYNLTDRSKATVH